MLTSRNENEKRILDLPDNVIPKEIALHSLRAKPSSEHSVRLRDIEAELIQATENLHQRVDPVEMQPGVEVSLSPDAPQA